jgi:hypothetical protein
MFKFIKTAALTALIGVGALGVAPASASGVYLGLGGGHHGASVGFYFGDGGHSYRGRHWDDDYRWQRACTPNRALNKAERMGVRHAYIRNVNRNVIKVSGRSRGERVTVVFARAPHCPVIRY